MVLSTTQFPLLVHLRKLLDQAMKIGEVSFWCYGIRWYCLLSLSLLLPASLSPSLSLPVSLFFIAFLKRKSSASDDEANLKRLRSSIEDNNYKMNHRLTPPFLPAIRHSTTSPPLLPPTPPLYFVCNNGAEPPSSSSSASPLLATHATHLQTVYPSHTTLPSSVPTFHIVQLNATPTTDSTHHQNGLVASTSSSTAMLLPSNSYTNNPASQSSSDSSDSESDNEQSSPQNSPQPTVIQAPPPLIPTSRAGLQNILMIPSQPHHMFASPSPPPSLPLPSSSSSSVSPSFEAIKQQRSHHMNGIQTHHHAQGQQILVPLTTIPTLNGKSSLLLQPLVAPATQNAIMQLNAGAVPRVGTDGGGIQYMRSFPLIVNAATAGGVAKGGLSPFVATSTSAGHTYQLLKIPGIEGGRGPTPPHQIVDEAH